MTKNKTNRGYRIWFVLSIVLFTAAIGIFLNILYQGVKADNSARELLADFEYSLNLLADDVPEPPEYDTIDYPQSDADENRGAAEALPSDDKRNIKENPIVKYDIFGKLKIKSLDLEIPIISTLDEKALKLSVCKYIGPEIGEKGNIVVMGHNFRNGSQFGRLNKIKLNDAIEFTGKNGETLYYEVYEIKKILPTDVHELELWEGERALTMITCVGRGETRFIVKCKEKI